MFDRDDEQRPRGTRSDHGARIDGRARATSDRGQAFTLEAFVAAILLVATLAFALQAVSISSNTAGVAKTEQRGQHVGVAEGVLDGTVERGNLTTTILYWNESAGRFHGADEDDGVYISPNRNTTFGNTTLGEPLETMFDEQRIRYNVDLHYYRNDSGELERETRRLIESGTPSDNAVRTVETVTLYDDTVLVDEEGEPRENATLEAIDEAGDEEFYAPDISDGPLYNVIRVEVVVWQT